jgi:hypothetical protein
VALFMVPPLDERPWPTLGPDLCDWIEANLVYGPGPLKGAAYVVEPEFRAEIYRMYEVFPRGHERAGRRRFKRAVLEKRKGTAKTEKAAILAAAEAHPSAPVRCSGWRRQGSVWVPAGVGVESPYIPMVAYTEEQSEDLAYGVLRQILGESQVADDFDIGLDRILVLDRYGREAGKIQALAGSPNARDGARTTFQHFDETHRMSSARLKNAHTTMVQNIFKIVSADAWTLETTTPGDIGEQSIAEDAHEYAELIAKGKVSEPTLFYTHRSAPLDMPMETADEVRAALLEATGPATWSSDVDALVAHWFEPKCDRQYYRRVWLAQWVPGGSKAFDAAQFAALVHEACAAAGPEGYRPPDGALITLGFDGARRKDTTALVATEVLTGFQWLVQVWERPEHADEAWEVPAGEVDAAVAECFKRWNVWRLYGDPPYWDEHIDSWAGQFGAERVIRWWTNRDKPMAHALRAYRQAHDDGDLSHDGHPVFVEHIGNSVKKKLLSRTDDDLEMWVIRKDRPDSPRKIDVAMAGCLSWEARGDAIAAGVAKPPPPKKSKRIHRPW